MKKSSSKSIRTVCIAFAAALAASFVLAEMPGLYDGPPGKDRKMNFAESGGAGSSVPAAHYIVALDETAAGDTTVQDEVIRDVEAFGGTVYRRYSVMLNGGFAATLPTRALEALQSNPYVAFVERDDVIGLPSSQTTDATHDAATADATGSAESGWTVPYNWGIDRINQRYLPLDYWWDFDGNGENMSVYVLDTGIRDTHIFFGGRAQQIYSATSGPGEDCSGHGTHIAATIHSIAPAANIFGVKVLDCLGHGSVSDVVAGAEWIQANADNSSIAAMGLGGANNQALNWAVNTLSWSGVPVVVPAGNEGQDACNTSPASATSLHVITVGATTTGNYDRRPGWSNWGECVDIFAPGVEIPSAWYTSDHATNKISGTSIAVAHAAGVLALADGNVSAVLANATPDVVTDPGPDSPNLFLYAD